MTTRNRKLNRFIESLTDAEIELEYTYTRFKETGTENYTESQHSYRQMAMRSINEARQLIENSIRCLESVKSKE